MKTWEGVNNMAITATADKAGRSVQVTFYVSPKTEEKLNEYGNRNVDPGMTQASNINKLINEGLVAKGLCDLE